MTPQTLQAAREILFAALTDPPLSYIVDNGAGAYASVTLPASSVVPRAVWTLGDAAPPTPYVCFAVWGLGSSSRTIGDRIIGARFWVVGDTETQLTFLYEAIRTLVNFGDQDAEFYATDLSRAQTSNSLGAMFREFLETRSFPPDYDAKIARWQLVAEYRGVLA